MTRRLTLPESTLVALLDRPDGDDLFALTDDAEIVAWLDARGLAWSYVDDQEDAADRLRRLFGTGHGGR